MSFNIFNTETGILKRTEKNRFGVSEVLESVDVSCYVEFEQRQIYDRDGSQIRSRARAFVDPVEVDVTQTWSFEHEGNNYQVESFNRVKHISTNRISHFELDLR